MRALKDLRGLLNRRQEAEGMRDKWDIAVDGFWDSHHRERVTSPLGLFKQCFGAALRAIAADGEENIDAATNEIVHSTGHVHRTTGSQAPLWRHSRDASHRTATG